MKVLIGYPWEGFMQKCHQSLMERNFFMCINNTTEFYFSTHMQCNIRIESAHATPQSFMAVAS